ncbi:hypothetical protein [Marinobacterium jannaschii]|uniref:hypothetical protein n=1 Tax=Marinobacterium jannaschii TaxID=64970 RepID=UPI000486F612|nr:hypothetical protein [Marinobacterium jannaschii]
MIRKEVCLGAIYSALLLNSAGLLAGEADVVDVKVNCASSCTIKVTVLHQDEGWEHYVDRWEVVSDSGEVLAVRTLYHPHVQEQPFTRAIYDFKKPDTPQWVTIRAHDSRHGFGGKTKRVRLPR